MKRWTIEIECNENGSELVRRWLQKLADDLDWHKGTNTYIAARCEDIVTEELGT